MSNVVWKDRVEAALARLQQDRWTAPAVRYTEIIDDVAAGNGSAADIARRHGSSEMVASAIGRVTAAMHGHEVPPRLEDGGWCETDGEHYHVAPDFAAHWRAARTAQRQIQALQAI